VRLFRSRSSGTPESERPARSAVPAAAAAIAIIIALGSVGVFWMARGANWISYGGPSSAARLSSPTPTNVKKSAMPMDRAAQFSAPSANVVWASLAGFELSRSTDRGNTWEQRRLPPAAGDASMMGEVSFLDARQGWYSRGTLAPWTTACGGEAVEIWHTSDGAATWSRQSPGAIVAGACEGLSFIDPSHGFLSSWGTGNSPTIYRTSDGGRSWVGATLLDPPGFKTQTYATLRAGRVKAFGSTLLVAASMGAPQDEYIFRSTDGGATWTYVARSDSRENRVMFVTESRWVILLAQLETIDSGRIWHSYSSDYLLPAPYSSEVVFAESLVGYGTALGGIQRTVDGGAHWVRIAMPGTSPPDPALSTYRWPNVPVGRIGAGLTYDAKHGYLLMFGGSTWVSDSVSSPPGFIETNRLLKFLSNETWIWDGNHWTLLHPPKSPPPGAFLAMAYDPQSQRVIVIGANGLAMWAWDGTNDWVQLT